MEGSYGLSPLFSFRNGNFAFFLFHAPASKKGYNVSLYKHVLEIAVLPTGCVYYLLLAYCVMFFTVIMEGDY